MNEQIIRNTTEELTTLFRDLDVMRGGVNDTVKSIKAKLKKEHLMTSAEIKAIVKVAKQRAKDMGAELRQETDAIQQVLEVM